MNLVMQLISLVGATLILGAFFFLQRQWWPSHGKSYLWANLVGSALLTIVAVADRRVGFILLEATWASVSAWSLAFPRASPQGDNST